MGNGPKNILKRPNGVLGSGFGALRPELMRGELVSFLEGLDEMGRIDEAAVVADLVDVQVGFQEQGFGMLEPPGFDPSRRRGLVRLLEVSLEG